MEKYLRRKFIAISMSAVFIVLFTITGFINFSNYTGINQNSDNLINIITDNDGMFPKHKDNKDGYELPPKMSKETPFSTRFFTAKFGLDNSIISIDTGKISAVSSSEAAGYADKILNSGKKSGIIDSYKYKTVSKDYGTLIVFIDVSNELLMFRSFLFNSIVICLVGIAAIFILIYIFSKKAISPIVESFEKQKQFITDASHELKTPLAIINTNADVLEMECGENEWIKSIHNQIGRMSRLITDLIKLTRMDEENHKIIKTDFSLSDAAYESIEAFKDIAKNSGKTLCPNIDKNVSCYGDEEMIRKLIYILLDNALKYSSENSSIILSIAKCKNKCMIKVENEAENLKCGTYDKLFERFFRLDSSRNSKTGGYGIGLSIAKSIILKHKGKITAESLDGKTFIIKALF